MRILLSFLLLSRLYAAVNIIQAGPAAHGAGTVISTFAFTPVVTDTVAVFVGSSDGTGTGPMACTDNATGGSNTYTKQISTATPAVPSTYWFTAPIVRTKASFTVTCVSGGSGAMDTVIFEIAHTTSATAVATCQNPNDLPNGTQSTTCNMTTTGDVLFLVGVGNTNLTSGYTAAGGATLQITDINVCGTGCSYGTASLQSGGVNGTYNPGFTMTGSGGLGTFPSKFVGIAIGSAASTGRGGYVYSR